MLSLPAGCRLLLYSDGLIERRETPLSERLDVFAVVAAVVAGLPPAPGPAGGFDSGGGLEDLCDGILAEIVAPAGRDDDVCLLTVGLD